MRLRPSLVLVVEANGAVLAEVIGITRFGGMAAFDAIGSAASNHIALAVDYKINLFGCLVMMRKVRAARCEVHQEQAGDHVGGIDGVALPGARTCQQLVQD